MLRVLVFLFALLTANVAVACDWSTAVCDFPNDAETRSRAAQYPVITMRRNQLGIDWNEALQDRFTRAVGIPVSCVHHVVVTASFNYNAAFCSLTACRSLKPSTSMTYQFDIDLSRRAMAGMAVYILQSPNEGDCAVAHLNRFGWRGSF